MRKIRSKFRTRIPFLILTLRSRSEKKGINLKSWGGIRREFRTLAKKELDPQIELLKLVLPGLLVDFFDLVKVDKQAETLHLYFEEFNKPPAEHANRELISKGFHDEITIQDFPLRGKHVFLHVKRRRWTDKNTNKIIQRDWNIVAKGTRMTDEFASFLKQISRF